MFGENIFKKKSYLYVIDMSDKIVLLAQKDDLMTTQGNP